MFSQQFAEDEIIPSTPKSTLEFPHAKVICKRAEATKQFLEEESGQSTFHCPSIDDPDLSHQKAQKCHMKQGLMKSSKKKTERSY